MRQAGRLASLELGDCRGPIIRLQEDARGWCLSGLLVLCFLFDLLPAMVLMFVPL